MCKMDKKDIKLEVYKSVMELGYAWTSFPIIVPLQNMMSAMTWNKLDGFILYLQYVGY
jgi:hypothetical protein